MGRGASAVPGWDDLHTDFISRLQATGAAPGEVDYVVNTHLHFDHVGWHTELVDGAWQPTFPAARYVMSAGEFGYWQSKPENEIADQHAGFTDSVLPIYEAGLVDLVADDHVVIDGVRFMPTPGHTPHHVSVLIESGGQSAVITGDVAHHPCQLAHPDWASTSDFDPDLARTSRMKLVERFADSDTLIIGSHYSDPVAGRIQRAGTELPTGVCRRTSRTLVSVLSDHAVAIGRMLRCRISDPRDDLGRARRTGPSMAARHRSRRVCDQGVDHPSDTGRRIRPMPPIKRSYARPVRCGCRDPSGRRMTE